MLDADELVLQLVGFALGVIEQLTEPRAHVRGSARARPAYLRDSGELGIDARGERRGRDAGTLEQRRHQAVGLREERREQMLHVDRLVSAARRERLRLAQCLLRLMGELFWVHRFLSITI